MFLKARKCFVLVGLMWLSIVTRLWVELVMLILVPGLFTLACI